MNKLIIFHPEKNTFIEAKSFTHLSFDRHEAYLKLQDFMLRSPDQVIVFRINFENIENSSAQKNLYHLPFMDIYLIHEYQEISNLPENQNEYPLYHLSPLVRKEKAKADIETIKERIKNGHFYQVNYSLPFEGKTDPHLSPKDLFTSLRTNFKGDFHALLPLTEDLHLLSFSPELFLKKDGENYFSEPIKGTAPIGEEKALLSSEKENAELSMIVDLLRNDMNEISDSKVRVNFHRKILELPHLLHTYSQIEGKSHKGLGTILKSMLPGGSISGCPKKESVKTIYELEPFAREHYTGVIGVLQRDKMRASIVIRSLVYNKKDGLFTYNAGSGIVYDSKTEDEIEEIFLKSKSLLQNPTWEKKPSNQSVIYPEKPKDFPPLKESYSKGEILFTTLLLNSDGPKDFDLHLERIFHSAQECQRNVPFSKEELRTKILQAIPKIDSPETFRLRINIAFDALFLEWQKLTTYKEFFLLDFCHTLSADSNDKKLNHKLNQYDHYYEALKKRSDVDDLIFINEKGLVTETTKANIFFIDNKNQKLWTPPISDGLLPGIERQKLLNLKKMNIYNEEYLIEEKSLSMIEVQENFTDVIITNSLMGIRYGKLKK